MKPLVSFFMSPDDSMNDCARSSQPPALPTKKAVLHEEPAPSDVAALFHLLEHFYHDVHESTSAQDILRIAETLIQRWKFFQTFGFFLAQPNTLEFHLQACFPRPDAPPLEQHFRHAIDSGTFAWALRQSRPVILDTGVPNAPGKILFHSLGTRSAVIGMFAGLLSPAAAPLSQRALRLLSVSLSTVAYALHHLPIAAAASHQKTPPGTSAAPSDSTNKSAHRAPAVEPLRLIAAGAVHDFQNVLTAIIGNLSLALRYPTETVSLQNWLNQAMKASFRAKDLSEQLLRALKGDAPRKQLIALPELLHDSASLGVQHPRVRLVFDIPSDLWPVEADPIQIGQVIQNIVLNGSQAMPSGGRLAISARNVEVTAGQFRALPSGRYVKLSIKDHGTGIQPADLQRIFEPYFTTKSEGHGLGLATCCSIIKEHHGHITVDSSLGHGATFDIYLPSIPVRTLTLAGPAKTAKTLLVLEQDFQLRELLPAMLAKIGLNVALASTTDEVLQLFQHSQQIQQPFAAVVLDLGASGKTSTLLILQELKKLDPSIQAIVSGGYAHDPTIQRCHEFGFAAALCKPYSIEQFSRTLQQVLS